VDLRESFGSLLGRWNGLERLAAGPGAAPLTARASFVFALAVADTVVVQDFRRVRDDGTELSGHGVFLPEPGSEGVLWWCFDTSAEPPAPVPGHWSDGLVLEALSGRGRLRYRFRAAGDRLDHSVHGVEVDPDGAERLEPVLVGTYRRLSGH
jgi:hypothetical protein